MKIFKETAVIKAREFLSNALYSAGEQFWMKQPKQLELPGARLFRLSTRSHPRVLTSRVTLLAEKLALMTTNRGIELFLLVDFSLCIFRKKVLLECWFCSLIL